jgi:hypothetical protein
MNPTVNALAEEHPSHAIYNLLDWPPQGAAGSRAGVALLRELVPTFSA